MRACDISPVAMLEFSLSPFDAIDDTRVTLSPLNSTYHDDHDDPDDLDDLDDLDDPIFSYVENTGYFSGARQHNRS